MAVISLFNKSGHNIDDSYISQIIALVNLPSGNLDLIFSNMSLPREEQGVCIPSKLVDFMPASYRRICRDTRESWNCCIAISSESWRYAENYPAYFTYLLAHEFGHARLCLDDLRVHVLCCLIHDFIREASNGTFQWPHQVPHEQIFDEFGIFISTQLHSKEQIHKEIEEMIQDNRCEDRERLNAMLRMEQSDRIASIHTEVIQFALPYKKRLIDLWKKDYSNSHNQSLASLVKEQDYEPLFNENT